MSHNLINAGDKNKEFKKIQDGDKQKKNIIRLLKFKTRNYYFIAILRGVCNRLEGFVIKIIKR